MPSGSLRYAAVVLAMLSSASIAAADLSYRDFALGASVAEVLAQTSAAVRDVTTVHARPALLQELSWRPVDASASDASRRDPVALIVFSFIDDRLFRIAVDYDRSRTEGLTAADMIEALTAVYGPRSTARAAAPPRPDFDSVDATTVIARWVADDTSIVLGQSRYEGGFGLVIASAKGEALARTAKAGALKLDAREAPARAAAREKAEAEAARAAAEKARTANKTTFTP